jgi:type III pantothenate kinase
VILLLDLGNTRLKWAWSAGEALTGAGSVTHRGRTLAELLDPIVPPEPEADVTEVRVASTAGPTRNGELAAGLATRFGAPVHLARSVRTAGGLVNGYRDHTQLGVDRWLAMRAAVTRGPGPWCVVDVGTATTVDLVDPDGRHQGGVIIPGPALMGAALRRETGDLDRLAGPVDGPGAPADHQSFGGQDTSTAIGLGIWRATAGLVEQGQASLGAPRVPVNLLVTGGDGAALIPWLGGSPGYRPLLVLEGLALAEPGELVSTPG